MLSLATALTLSCAARGEIKVYTDQSAFESAILTCTDIDFEGIPFGELKLRMAGYSWDGLVAGIKMYQMDAEVTGYYGIPFLSDFVASTMYDKPVLFELPINTNAVGGNWFHSQVDSYNGHFLITLADSSTFEYVYEDIATGRELGVPDYCGFICTDQDIAAISYRVENSGGDMAGSMADNIKFGYGAPLDHAYKNWNPDPEFFAGAFDAYTIVADDITIAAGYEGEEIEYFTLDVMSWAPNGANLDLLIYDDDPASGLPGTLLSAQPLTYLEYGEWKQITVEGDGVVIPPDGFLWVAVQADVGGAGWFIADQEAQTGSSEDGFAMDVGTGFYLSDFGTDILSNMNLVITVAEEECAGDVTGDGTIDVLDLLAVLAVWGQQGDLPEDVNGDGVVDVLDLLDLLGMWGPCP